MLHTSTPALGDEQVLDIELDRNTMFRQAPPSRQCSDPWEMEAEAELLRAPPIPVTATPGESACL